MKNKKAFSLIELSIVILIIGILIAGVTQSSRLLRQSRVSSARTLTQSSPVNSIKDLALWLETTTDASFKTNGWNDGDLVANDTTGVAWYDINSQTSYKNHAATSSGNATYVMDGINGLPVLKFNGASNLVAANFPTFSTGNYTLFIVYQSSLTQNGTVLSDRNGAAPQVKIQFSVINSGGGGYQICDNVVASCFYSNALLTINNNTNYVFSAVYTAGATVSYYQNGGNAVVIPGAGATPVSGATGAPGPSAGGLYIGSVSPACCLGNYFTGLIGEIIIFDRALKNEERTAIQNYLGRKWGIKIT